ncbi:MAG TPA: DUF1684 domain-containing protein [Pyrinomonadaceae bacterium]|nr:DUF1684 domain-containing protein [Pyrinomonadaceae bacterium]
MRFDRHFHAAKTLFLLVVLFVPVFSQRNIGPKPSVWEREIIEWREEHAAALQKPDGWLSLIGLEWLQAGDTSFGSAADNKIHLPDYAPAHLGVLRLEGETVTLLPPREGFTGALLTDGKPAEQQILFVGKDSDQNNPRLTAGSLKMYVIKRGDRFGLRIKDAKSAGLIHFSGLKWFKPDSSYRVIARWIPYQPQVMMALDTLVGTRYTTPVPGVAEFRLGNKRYRLEPTIEEPNEEHADRKLFFIIRDLTSKSTTYGACRFLYTDLPDHGLTEPGQLVLDFNRLENPPCAYTTFATCPLPPPGNRLKIAIPAGEKRYHYK